MKLGRFSVHYLNGGITNIDGGAMFGVVPRALWIRKYEVNNKNQIPLPTHPILVQTDDKNVIIDTGIGFGKLTDKERRNFGAEYESHINEDLEALDMTTKDIDYVLMTHMHFDLLLKFGL